MDQTAHAPDARFEYRELVIPLDLRLGSGCQPTRRELAAFHGAGGVVVEHLGAAAREGWYPDEAANWASLAAAGRFATEIDHRLVGPEEGATIYRSVTIRLKRILSQSVT